MHEEALLRVGAGVVKDTAPPSCYGYPGIQHDPVVQLDSGDDNDPCGVLVDSLEWLHDKLGIATHQGGFSSCQFNSVVVNKYEYGLDQYIPWHTDSNRNMIGPRPLIASISLDCPGAVAFAPRMGTNFASRWLHNRRDERGQKQKQKEAGVRGALPLLPAI